MGAVHFAARLSEEQAWEGVSKKAPGIRQLGAELSHHPFSGFVHGYRTASRWAGESRIHTLVDRLTGKTFITDPWPPLLAAEGEPAAVGHVADPGWNTIGFEAARQRSGRLVSTAIMRKNKLGRDAGIREVASHELIWKPNWLLEAALGDRKLRILVDGMNGGYYVVGS